MSNTIPATLLVGQPESTRTHAIKRIQQQHCTAHGCGTCTACAAIARQQYHALLWLEPENAYTLEILEPLFERLAFAQDPEQAFFFVLNHADRLNDACTNALLKSIEEPPPSYYFILLARALDAIAPTIRSRCHIVQLDMPSAIQSIYEPLFEHFTTRQSDPATFLNALDRAALSEHDALMFINALFEHFSQQACNAESLALAFVPHVQKLIKQPPLPGSAKIYLRQLYLQWHDLTSTHMPSR